MTPHALLLAAGKSNRTWPFSEKIFFKILGKTLLEHQIHTLIDARITDICVVGNTENIDRIREICRKIPNGNFVFAVQKNLDHGIAGGILSAEKFFSSNRSLLVVCSNDIVEKDAFENIVSAAEKSNSDIFLMGKKVENYFPGGYLQFFGENKKSEEKKIRSIVEKPKPGTEPSNVVTLLIHLFTTPKSLFTALKTKKREHKYEEVLQQFFDTDTAAEVVFYTGFWQAIKYPWHFLEISRFFRSQIRGKNIHQSAYISPNSVLSGNIIIEEGVKILDFSVVKGPAYIGKNTIIANHVLFRDSEVGENGVIGHGTEVARSVLQNDCWTHKNFVGDSIFDNNVSLGAGTITGNLRLDEQEIYSEIKGEKIGSQQQKIGAFIGKESRIGINTSLMPGIKIGAKSFIGAQCLIGKDIQEKSYITQKSITKCRENNTKAFLRKKKNFPQ